MTYQLPETDAVKSLMDQLIGDCPAFDLSEDSPEFDALGPETYASVCIDKEDNPVCIILADMEASICLGGKLMMLGPGALEDQLEEKKVDDIVVEALSEIFNNMTSVLNRTGENTHVRSTPAKKLSELVSEGAWPEGQATRVDFVGDFLEGKGRLVLIAK